MDNGFKEVKYQTKSETLGVDAFTVPIYSFVDSKNLELAITSTTLVNDKWLRINIATIQQAVLKHNIIVKWIEGPHMIADCMTKRTAKST